MLSNYFDGKKLIINKIVPIVRNVEFFLTTNEIMRY